MPDIKIVKQKVRRGLESQRILITLDQGELGYTTDSKRLFVGDGSIIGGTVVGSRNFTPITSNKTGLQAYVGDIVVENSLMWQLTASNSAALSSWSYVGPAIDGITINFTGSNALQIANGGVSAIKLGNVVYNHGGLVLNPNVGLSANVDNYSIRVNSTNQLVVSSIDASNISGLSSLAGPGLSALGAGLIAAKADGNSIVIGVNGISVGVLDAGVITTGTFGASRIASSAIGVGLVGGNGTQISLNYDANSLDIVGGKALVKSLYNATYPSLCASGSPFSGFSTLTGGGTSLYTVTTASPINGNTTDTSVTFVLSSAGFIIIDFGTPFGKKAIPIFNIPAELQNVTVAGVSV